MIHSTAQTIHVPGQVQVSIPPILNQVIVCTIAVTTALMPHPTTPLIIIEMIVQFNGKHFTKIN